jgi:BirA family transcriptional regulator, biotin operon repressor / biotin---[acetyl-CoA-carboxylase] ligase
MNTPYRIHSLSVTQSTNDDAKQAARGGEAEGFVIWAWEQKAGRGRQGRVWHSPPGNLYASILLRPACDARYAAHYAFVAALALYDVVKAYAAEATVTLKWPNDVLLGGKKISGVLLESSIAPSGKLEWLVVGMGLNIEHYPEGMPYTATSLRAEGASNIDLEAIIQRLCKDFFGWKETLEKQGFAPIRTAWTAHAQPGKLSVHLPKGVVEGDFAGLNDDGGLLLQLADGTIQAISAGDVFFAS